jgi:hypothetical protein
MKKLVTTLAGAACLVAATATIAAATTTTTTDVQSLATAEANVVALLHKYQDTPAWKASFKVAVATQTADLGTLNDALYPVGTGTVVYQYTGEGEHTTSKFVVPSSAKGWNVNWSYNCANDGGTGNFDFEINGGSGNDNGPNQLGAKGSGVEHYYDTGVFYLQVLSECNWTIQAVVVG